jgi:hypothetical protein
MQRTDLEPCLAFPKTLRAASASVLAAVMLSACGGGESPFSVTVAGSAGALSGGLEGGEIVLKSLSDNSTRSVSSVSGTYELPGFNQGGASAGVIVDRHPLNQLCVVRSAAAEPSMRLECVPKRLNDTGLSVCRSGAPCPSEDAGSGRDANAAQLRKAGVIPIPRGFDYTRICNNGLEEGRSGCTLNADSNPGDADGDWGCTRDNVTGLVWRVLNFQDRLNFVEAQDRADSIQEQSWCGRNEWKLPSVHELKSVLNSAGPDRGVYRIAASLAFLPPFDYEARDRAAGLNSSGLEVVDRAGYWTAEPAFDNDGNAWAVSFEGAGRVKLHPMTSALHIVPVSTADFKQRFVDSYHNDARWQLDTKAGTLLDRRSGLMWMVCSAGRSYNEATGLCEGAGAFTFDQALALPASVNAGDLATNRGYADWRLPNRAELGSLVDFQQQAPAVSSDNTLTLALRQDLGVTPGSYWTSSWVTGGTGSVGDVFVVNFVTGEIGLSPQFDLPLRVRLVRDAR